MPINSTFTRTIVVFTITLLLYAVAPADAATTTATATASATATAATAPGNCTIIPDVAISSADLYFYPGSFSAAKCCALCQSYSFAHPSSETSDTCAAFTTNSSGCTLKASSAGIIPSKGATSGVAGTTPGPAPGPGPSKLECKGKLKPAQCKTWQNDIYDRMGGIYWQLENPNLKCKDARSDPCSCGGSGCIIDKYESHPHHVYVCVKCAGGDMIGMTLRYNVGIKGSLPSSIRQLTGLKYLDLYSNEITGSIPSSIGQLTKLTHLDLHENRISGSIPSSIEELTGLTYLHLSKNKMTGRVPPLNFSQYTDVCWLSSRAQCPSYERQCNHFTCPLPPHADQCKQGVRCG